MENEAGSGKQEGRASIEREERRKRKSQRSQDTATSSQAQENKFSPVLDKYLFHPEVGTGLAGWPGLW